MDVVVYKQSNGVAAVFYPAAGTIATSVAKRVVPKGVPYWISPIGSIPTDRTYRELWEVDLSTAGDPDGYGEME